MTGLLLICLVSLAVYAAVSLIMSRQQAFARAEEARQLAAAEAAFTSPWSHEFGNMTWLTSAL
jgi:hypothetical protein